jgi:N-acetyl-anhydromuramyl-L-alanine amidase AmpD
MDDGEIQQTFRWREQIHGAHAKSPNNEYNEYGIGICLVGNFEESDPSDAQLASIKRLVSVLKHEYQLTDSQVIGHRDVKATACPGKNFPIGEISRSSVFPVLAGRYGNYGTEPPADFQIVTVERSNVR